MAIALVDATEANNTDNSSSLDILVPAAALDGDLLVLLATGQGADYPIAQPSGWSTLDTRRTGTGVSDDPATHVFYRLATASGAGSAGSTVTLTPTATGRKKLVMLAYSGASGPGVWGVNETAGGDVAAPSITLAASSSHLLCYFAAARALAGSKLTPDSPLTDRHSLAHTYTQVGIGDQAVGASGATGTRTATASGATGAPTPEIAYSIEILATTTDRTLVLAATRQARTAAFAAATVLTATLAATMPTKSATFTIDAAADILTATLAATRQARTSAFTLESGVARTLALVAFREPRAATFTGRVVVPVTPAPLLAAGESRVVAHAFGAVAMTGSQPVYTVASASTARARQRVLVDGVDVTYFRGAITPQVTYTLLEPLLYGPGTLDLPQVSACFERPGHGELAWLRPGAPVEVHRVLDDELVAVDYKGVVVAFDTSGRNLSVELGGEASGRAALRNRQPVIFARVNDLGHQISDAVRDLGLPHLPALGVTTGIEALTTGGVGHLEHIQNLVAKAWTRSGGHWTVMPDEDTGIYRTFLKDEEVVHATAFLDDAQTVGTLRRDIAEEENRVYVTGVTPQGQRVRFGVYPGLIQGPVPPFPGHLESGDSGDGVRLLLAKLHAVGYLRLYEVAGGYDFDVVEAVEDLQRDAGLPVTGEVNEATWDALYDLNITGTSLEGAHIEPAAQRSEVRQKNRSASGTVLGFNDDYDPDILKVDRNVDMGTGLNRSQMRRFARTVLNDSNDGNWVGDITFHTGALLAGDIAVGATVTEADVMDARELRPGMNLSLPLFAGGKLLHVSACQVGEDGTVTATVDTRWRDAMEVWEVIARNKESRNDPARRRNRDVRSSTIAKDSIGEWDEIGGLLGYDVSLEAGWNVFEVVAATEGTISRLRIRLDDAAEFACAVFGRAVDPGWLDDIIGDPLTTAGTKAWQTKRDTLDDRWLLYSAGTKDEPCGYSPGRKGDGDVVTGKHNDDAGFAYRSWDRTKVYVAVHVPDVNLIPEGRVLWPQLEAGV